MSVHAGSILLVAGNNVVDRLQSHGLGDVRVPVDTIREVGNENIVDKVPTEPDFTFSLQSFDVGSTEFEAFLSGQRAATTASGAAPGFADADGTAYSWNDCEFVNLISPWKDSTTGSAGVVVAGHIVPGFYPTRVRYRFGVTENSTQEAELAGGSFYYGKFAPYEEEATGDGATLIYNTAHEAIRYRKGGAGGTTFKSVFGVIVDGVLQVEGTDYTLTGGAAGPTGATATVTFLSTATPANGKKIRYCYFTPFAQAYPNAVHASTVIKPAAIRGKHICVSIAASGTTNWTRFGQIQSCELEATVDGQVERELCNEEIVGRTINGRDTNGNIVVRSKDYVAFHALLKKVTGVDTDTEVIGFINQEPVKMKIEILNPKNPAQVLKTLYVEDAIFPIPGTPAQVNQATDFSFGWESKDGTFTAFKGAMA